MSHILLVEKDRNLAEMYKSIFEGSGFRVIHFSNYKDLYKNLNGEGFTAIFLDNETTGRTLDFISKIRKNSKRQIPIYVMLNDDTDQDPFLMFEKTSCISRFPESGNITSRLTSSLNKGSRFKNLLHQNKLN